MVGDDFPDGISQPDGIIKVGLDEVLLWPTRGTAPSENEDGVAGAPFAPELGIEHVEHVPPQESRCSRDQPGRHDAISAFSPEP